MNKIFKGFTARIATLVGGAVVGLALFALPQAALAQTLAIDDVSQIEGNAGTTTMTFTVTLTGAAPGAFTVDYATANVTATAPSDYVAATGTLNFAGAAGEAQVVNITINGDATFEPNETFNVNLSNVTPGVNATIADSQGVGTIQNDDLAAVPTLSEWAMILLGLLLAGGAALMIQRRQQTI